MRWFQSIMCRFGNHRRLQVIQSFGAAEHIGCPDCRRELAIHHGMQAVVPWDSDIADMYRRFGYDVDGATTKWREHTDELAHR